MRLFWSLVLLTALAALPVGLTAQQSPSTSESALPDAPKPSHDAPLPVHGAEASSTAADSNASDAGLALPVTPSGRIIPSNRAANANSSGYDNESEIIKVHVNAVPVPVTVKDSRGHLFPGLTKDNFSVYEDGIKQPIAFFTSDPFPVSCAILIDVGMPELVLRQLKDTFGALTGAFSQFDEVSIYTYANTVNRQQDYVAALGDTTSHTLTHVKSFQGTASGPPVYNPMTSGPTVNGRAFDPGQQHPIEYGVAPREATPSSVLNDAMLRAALDLGRRDKARRRILFVLSDGRESGSRANFNEVLDVLNTYNITVYGIEIDAKSIPGYSRIAKWRIPLPKPFAKQEFGDILPKYASKTGGEIFREFNSQAMETAYGSAMEEGRSQYTLVYYTDESKSTSFRKIEVRVSGYGPSLKVITREGYKPAPQSNETQSNAR